MRAAIALLALTCAGCTIGQRDFSCPSPTGITCMSTREVYDRSTAGTLGTTAGDSATAAQPPTDRFPLAPWTNAPSLDAPQPLRAPPKIMRIWIPPFEDRAGDLHMPSLVYVELEPRRWLIGDRELPANQHLTPLAVRQESNQGVGSNGLKPP